jgi:hypothetical protein
MDTEEGFENASYETSEGDRISGSESGPWSKSEGTESLSDSEGGESPSKALQETQVPLTAYEAARLKKIESNNKKLEELGLQALATEVEVPKAEKGRHPEKLGAGRVQVSLQVGEVSRITRSRRAPSPTSLSDQARLQVSFHLGLYSILVLSCNPKV